MDDSGTYVHFVLPSKSVYQKAPTRNAFANIQLAPTSYQHPPSFIHQKAPITNAFATIQLAPPFNQHAFSASGGGSKKRALVEDSQGSKRARIDID